MNTDISPRLTAPPRWTTSAFGHPHSGDDNVSSGLGEHLNSCRSVNGRWFALRCGVDVVHRFLAPRLVTTLVVVALLVGTALSVG